MFAVSIEVSEFAMILAFDLHVVEADLLQPVGGKGIFYSQELCLNFLVVAGILFPAL